MSFFSVYLDFWKDKSLFVLNLISLDDLAIYNKAANRKP